MTHFMDHDPLDDNWQDVRDAFVRALIAQAWGYAIAYARHVERGEVYDVDGILTVAEILGGEP